MAGVKGRSGKPKDKPFTDALRMEIAAAGEDHKRLRRIAAKALDLAEAGESWAVQFVADRLEGKPAQSLDIQSESTIRYVARVPEKAATPDQWKKQHSPTPLPKMIQ